MTMAFNPIRPERTTIAPFLDRLKSLYAEIDNTFTKLSSYYGFRCKGCTDNCCRTRFFHFTFSEYFFIVEGFRTLSSEMRQKITDRAFDVGKQPEKADREGTEVRFMCPLNIDGLCVLYEYRPMICRLHGIPHELHRPGNKVVYGPGCGFFETHCHHKEYVVFDRTSVYAEIAELEKELRAALRTNDKIKLSIAQMLLNA